MASPNPPHDPDLRRALAELRRALLDLTKRNRLLNFRFSKRSVRIVNDSADRAWQSLQSGTPVRLLPAPAKTVTAGAEVAQVTPIGSLFERGQRPERAAMLDVALGEWQPVYELNPDFEDCPSGASLQSAHDRDELDARLASLYSETKLALQETGTNFLHMWFGALEWNDTNDKADAVYTAPLLVVPVGIERELDRRTRAYGYRLRTLDDELQANITLREKLLAIADLDLPPYDSTAGCHEYFEEVERLVERFPSWRVRPFACISMLSFGKVLMYHDLDPEHWPDSHLLDRHPVLRQLLRLDGIGNVDDVDVGTTENQAPSRRVLPPIVVDADGSQHMALADAIEGKNLVIEGPPGTGKSQTIVNLLATAAGAGKRVLFVGEKQAALDVVYNRLKAVGLEHLVLELHSNHAEKREVLASLAKSLLARNDARPWTGFKVLDNWKRRRDQLGDYVRALNSSVGAIDWTLHQVLWRAKRAESQLPPSPKRLLLIDWQNAESLDRHVWQERHAMVQQYAQQYERLTESGHSPDNHPWLGCKLSDVSLFQEGDVRARLETFGSALLTFQERSNELARLTGADVPDKISQGQTVVEAWRQVPIPGSLVRSDWTRALVSAVRRQTILEFVRKVEDYRQAHQELVERWPAISDGRTSRDEVRAALKRCIVELSATATISDAQSRIAYLSTVRDAADAVDRVILRCNQILRLEIARTIEGASHVVAIVSAVENLPKHAEGVRHRGLLAAESDHLLDSHAPVLTRIHGQRKSVDEGLRTAAVPRDLALLLSLAQSIDRPAIARLVSPDAWRARRVSKAALRQATYDRRRVIQLLRDYADVIEVEDELAADETFVRVCGPFWRGGYTDLAALKDARRWIGGTTAALAIAGADRLIEAVVLADATLLRSMCATPSLPTLSDQVHLLGGYQRSALSLEELASHAAACADVLLTQVRTLGDGAPMDVPFKDLLELVDRAEALDSRAAILSKDADAAAVMGREFRGVDSDLVALKATVEFVEGVRRIVTDSILFQWLLDDPRQLVPVVHEHTDRISESIADVLQTVRLTLDLLDADLCRDSTLQSQPVAELMRRISRALSSSEADFRQFWEFDRARARLANSPESDLLDMVARSELSPQQLESAHLFVFCRALVKRAFGTHEHLASFTEVEHSSIRQQFQALDRELIKEYRTRILSSVTSKALPAGNGVGPVATLTQLALLRHEMSKERRHIPLRQLFSRAGTAIQALKPIVMMSPLSTAQFLPPGEVTFDLVVMDEASQLRPEDALGAVVRGGQLVVVGDRKQLPPTRFFDALADDSAQSDDSDAPDFAQQSKEAESILDLAHSVYAPSRLLQWHYRSRHEALIAFSNARFYDSRLVVFPSPMRDNADRGVTSVFVEDAVYEASLNVAEARRVVELALEHMSNSSESLGLVAMNVQQRDLIQTLLDEALRSQPAAQQFVEEREGTLDELFIKNLENVQGDERDVILISLTYGPSPNGHVHQRFGPINSASGHRRLNVLFTRAKHRLILVTSMRSEHVLAEGARHEGVKVLRDYLEYSATGKLAGVTWSGRAPDSDFEVEVADALNRHGYETVAQLGVAGYFIDIVVRDPRSPGRFLLAVECDGATYHSAKSARDRDRLREMVLRDLGWKVHRVWSTAWFNNKAAEVRRLLDAIPVAGMS